MTKTAHPDVPELLEKAIENFRIDSAYLRMKSRDAIESDDTRAAEVLSTASVEAFQLAASFERLQRAFERRQEPQPQGGG